MAKYQVLKRTEVQIKNEKNEIIEGEMVEFVQIPDEGPSQVQVYFVPEGKSDAEILGVSAQHHENELKEKQIGFTGPQSPMNEAETKIEPVMEVSVSSTGKVTAKEAIVDKEIQE